jgi:hypothetical protein
MQRLSSHALCFTGWMTLFTTSGPSFSSEWFGIWAGGVLLLASQWVYFTRSA